MAKKESNEQKKTIWEKLGLDAGGDLQKRQTLVVGGIGVALIVTIIVVALIIRAVNQPTTFVKETDLSKPSRNVERKYLDAADGLISSVSKTDASKDLETSLAYTWANHQYWLATGDEKHLEAALDGLNISESKLPTKNTEIPELGTSPDHLGLACVMLKDMYEDAHVSADNKNKAQTACNQAADNFWVSEKLHEQHTRLAEGWAQAANREEVTFYNYQGWIIKEISDHLLENFKKYQADQKTFSWYDDEQADPVVIDITKKQQLQAMLNKFYRLYYYGESITNNPDSEQNAKDTLDWLWLTGQTFSWYVRSQSGDEAIIFDPDDVCLLHQNFKLYLASLSANDRAKLTINYQIADELDQGFEAGNCQVIGIDHYNPETDNFAREVNLTRSSAMSDEPDAERLTMAGILTQEEKPVWIPDHEAPETFEIDLSNFAPTSHIDEDTGLDPNATYADPDEMDLNDYFGDYGTNAEDTTSESE